MNKIEPLLLEVVIATLTDAYSALSQSPFIWAPLKKALPKQMARDVATIHSLANQEKPWFTEVLPALGSYYDAILCGSGGSYPCPVGFKTNRETGVPLFLQVFWQHARLLVRRLETGHAPSDIDIQTVRAIRTLLLGGKKLELPPTREQLAAALNRFAKNERDLADLCLDSKSTTSLLQVAQEVLTDLLSDFENSLSVEGDYVEGAWVPSHGPGAVAGQESGLGEKSRFHRLDSWPLGSVPSSFRIFRSRLRAETNFSMPVKSIPAGWRRAYQRYVSGFSLQENHLYGVDVCDEELVSRHARLIPVPKDSRGPRLIAAEPKELMWEEQGVLRALVTYVEGRTPTRGHVNFSDQEINRELARESSLSHQLATIDLTDASDRVSLSVVQVLFGRLPKCEALLRRLRSTNVTYEGRVSPPLHKFAMMGSALCFPIEALVFWSTCVAALRLSGETLEHAYESVWVYGDDIVVPSIHMERIAEALASIGLLVNMLKSFGGRSFFRESCGMDAFAGKQTAPLRVRKLPPQSVGAGSQIAAWVDYGNQAFCAGLFARSNVIRRAVEAVTGHLPVQNGTHAYFHWLAGPFLPVIDRRKTRWNPDLQLVEIKALVPVVKTKRCEAPEGDFRSLFSLVTDLTDRGISTRTMVPAAIQTAVRWVPLGPTAA